MNSKFRLPLLLLTVLMIALLAVGCQVLAQPTDEPVSQDAIGTAAAQTVAAVLPTATTAATEPPPPAATETPAEPTLTPIGAASPTPVTPTAPATPDPNLNVTDTVLYEDTFDGKAGWFWTFSDEVADFGAVDGELRISTKPAQNTWRYIYRDNVTAADMQLRILTKAGACPGTDELGIMYRGRLDEQQKLHTYIFKLNCAGQARVEILDDITTTVLKDWETFPAIKAGAPAENAIMIWMQKDQFNFYVNDQYLFSLSNNAMAEGFLGFYVQSHSNGGGQFVLDDMVVHAVVAK